MSHPSIRHTELDGLHELELDRPPANALDPDLISGLREALGAAISAEARGVLLKGREGMFSAGLDVPAFLQLDRAAVGSAWASFFGLMHDLATSPVPIAAALTGHAPAGGCVLALFCDWRVMATGRFKIGLNEVRVGVRMPRPIFAAAEHVVGRRLAARMTTTAELIDPETALAWGLVDELAPVEEVAGRARAWLETVASLPPGTLRRSRVVAREDLAQCFDGRDEDQLELFLDEWFAEECQTALRDLVERLKK